MKTMSTRSLIAVQQAPHSKDEQPKYKVIYCHFDGYPDGVGHTLVNHYNDTKKAHELIALGDLSSLNENLAPEKDQEHSFDKQADKVTVAYGRDRGEENTEARTVQGVKELFDIDSWQEYIYIWKPFVDMNSMGMWECYEAGNPKDIIDLYKLSNKKNHEE